MKKNVLAIAKVIIYFSILCLALLSGIERLIWTNMKSYPHILVEQYIKAQSKEDEIVRLRKSCGEPLEIKNISPSLTEIRCGLLWPLRTITLVNVENK